MLEAKKIKRTSIYHYPLRQIYKSGQYVFLCLVWRAVSLYDMKEKKRQCMLHGLQWTRYFLIYEIEISFQMDCLHEEKHRTNKAKYCHGQKNPKRTTLKKDMLFWHVPDKSRVASLWDFLWSFVIQFESFNFFPLLNWWE